MINTLNQIFPKHQFNLLIITCSKHMSNIYLNKKSSPFTCLLHSAKRKFLVRFVFQSDWITNLCPVFVLSHLMNLYTKNSNPLQGPSHSAMATNLGKNHPMYFSQNWSCITSYYIHISILYHQISQEHASINFTQINPNVFHA